MDSDGRTREGSWIGAEHGSCPSESHNLLIVAGVFRAKELGMIRADNTLHDRPWTAFEFGIEQGWPSTYEGAWRP